MTIDKGMSIIVLGFDHGGITLVERLSREEHDITVINKKREPVQYITDTDDVICIVGIGAGYSVHKEAGNEKMGLIIADIESEQVNAPCCMVVKRFSGRFAIVRVHRPVYREASILLRLAPLMPTSENLGLSGNIGVCVGSPSGIKVKRVLVLYKALVMEVGFYTHPRFTKQLQVEGLPVDREAIASINVYQSTDILPFDMLTGQEKPLPVLILFHPTAWKQAVPRRVRRRR